MQIAANRHVRVLVAALTAAVLMAGGLAGALIEASAVRADPPSTPGIIACVSDVDGTIRLVSDPSGHPSQTSLTCTGSEHEIDWSLQGPTGPTGPAGATGATGAVGASGSLDAGTAATASQSDTTIAAMLSSLQSELAGDQKDEAALSAKQQHLAATLPDARRLPARIRRLIGAHGAAELAASTIQLKPVATAGWGPGMTESQVDALDSMNEVSEIDAELLQMTMDRRSKLIEALSNLMKKIDSTQQSVVDNLKS